MDIKNYLTVEQVAKRIGLTEERVRELINLKEIKATKIKQWRILSGRG
jgi:excisionase family DNA binding protein